MAVGDSAGEGREISGRRRTQLGLFPNGNVLIGAFPKHKEVLIGGAGFGRVALEGVGASEAEAGERMVCDNRAVVNELLQLGSSFFALVHGEMGLSTDVEDRECRLRRIEAEERQVDREARKERAM